MLFKIRIARSFKKFNFALLCMVMSRSRLDISDWLSPDPDYDKTKERYSEICKFVWQEVLETLNYKIVRKAMTVEELSKQIKADPAYILDLIEFQISEIGSIEKNPGEPATYSITEYGQDLITDRIKELLESRYKEKRFSGNT